MHTENTSVTIITYMTQYTTARQYNMNEYMCFKFAYPLYCLYDMHSAFMTTVIYIYIVRSLHMTEVSPLSALICSAHYLFCFGNSMI